MIFLLNLFVSGCGSSNNETFITPGGGGGNAPQPTARIVIENDILTRAVPVGVTQIRVTVLNANDQIVTGPLSFTPAPRIEVETTPGANLTLRIEYLVGNTLVGLFEDVISLQAGQTVEIEQSEIDFVDASGLLTSLAVTPTSSTLTVGQTVQLTATGSFSDGGQGALTSQVEWTATGGVTVSSSGLVTATAPGAGSVTATIFGQSSAAQFSVSAVPAGITSLTVTPATATLAIGATQQFTATAALQGGGQRDVSSQVTWTSSGNVTISSTGLATATAAGTSTITATFNGLTSTAQVTVQAPPAELLTELSVSPATTNLVVGGTVQLTAAGQYPSGSVDVTNQATWSSSGNATVSATGLVTATAVGTSTITATFGDRTSTAQINISAVAPPVTVTSLTIDPRPSGIVRTQSLQLTAYRNFSNGTRNDVTSTVTWTSSDPAVATVTAGLVTGVTDGGPVTITANDTATGKTATLALTVAATAPTSVSGFDDYNLGSVNGQKGWVSTGTGAGLIDQAVVAVNTVPNAAVLSSFGTQALRLSNAVTTGNFLQTYAAPITGYVGETAATDTLYPTTGTRYNHFEYEFDFGTTTANFQPGLNISVSHDRGDLSRMSFLRFDDKAAGIDVVFVDYLTANPNTSTILTGLSRNTPHHVRVAMTTIDGPSNDVVKVYIDGNLIHTGTSWEQYFRTNPEASAEQSPRRVDTISLVCRNTAAPANMGNGYLFDNVQLSAFNVDPVTLNPVP